MRLVWFWHLQYLFSSWDLSPWCFCCCHTVLRSTTLEMLFISSRKKKNACSTCYSFLVRASQLAVQFLDLCASSHSSTVWWLWRQASLSSAKGRIFRKTKVFSLATPLFKEPWCFAELISTELVAEVHGRLVSEEAKELVYRKGWERLEPCFFQQLGKHSFGTSWKTQDV